LDIGNKKHMQNFGGWWNFVMLSGKYKRVGDLSFIGEIVAEGRSFIAPVGGVVEA